jgi:hypothetical protein
MIIYFKDSEYAAQLQALIDLGLIQIGIGK